MPRILNSYISREIAWPFALSIVILTATSLLSKVLKLVELTINHGVGFFIILKFIIFIIPSFLIYIIPISFLIAVLITYNRLSSDNEITVMKASGLSILKISRPVIFTSLFAFSIALFFTIYAFPWGSLSSKRLLYDVARNKANIGLKERVFNDTFNDLILYANRINQKNGELEGVFISDHRDEKTGNIIAAKNGVISSDTKNMKITLRLLNGTIHREEKNGLYKIITFDTYDLNLSLEDGRIRDPDSSKTNRDLTANQLMEKIDEVRKKGEDPAPHIIDLHKRFALPASIFVFGLLGVPLGIQKVRTTRFTSFTTGLAVVLFHYVLSTALESLGEKGLLNPIVAVWGSDMVMAVIGISIFYKATKDSPIKSLAWIVEKRDAAIAGFKNMLPRKSK